MMYSTHTLGGFLGWRQRVFLSFLMTGSLGLGAGCLGGEEPEPDQEERESVTNRRDRNAPVQIQQTTPITGETSFYSADGYNGQATQENNDRNAADPASQDDDGFAGEAGGGDERVAEEGDIYQVVNGSQNLIFNLNRYRGLQIIDFSDAQDPQIVGRVNLSGTPVEMYQVGDRLFVLLNNWYSYWRSERYATTPQSHYGGGVVVVDISDKSDPKVVTQAPVDGWIRTSRLTRGNGKEALYVVSNEWNGGGETHVNSFSVSEQGKLEQRSSIALGGYVQDIQATGQRLLVSRYDYQQNRTQSEISILDISSEDGDMVEGDSVFVEGRINNKFNMHLHDDVLRIVSSNSWNTNSNTNYVQTYNASDINNLTLIDQETFGDNEDLYATLFMEDRAFFVTYRRTDPFHAFSISPTGELQEESEFIISGWNDYFQAVSQKSRLIGIGKNDEDGRNTMAVSLYDVTDLKNPNPLITRAEIELDRSWSEAQWDDRAFSVLEKGTSILSGDGTATETGVVLLPFSGWNEDEKRYISAVQIYTFSKDTLTLRGVMEHGSHVRRSFVADKTQKLTGNLSESELSLYNTHNPDLPIEQGRVELAPNYTSFEIYGNYGVRHHNRSNYYGWWGNHGQMNRQDSLQIVPLSAPDVDRAEPVATIDIPANANTYRAGDNLVVVSTVFEPGPNNDYQSGTYTSEMEVWDLSQPSIPVLKSTTQTDRIRGYSNNYYGWDDCWDCGYYYGYNYRPEAYAAGDALVFPRTNQEQLLEGSVHRRTIYPTRELQRYSAECYTYNEDGEYTNQACAYYGGSIQCTQLTRVDGTVEPESCQGDMFSCTQDAAGEQECSPIEADDIETRVNEYDNDQYRRWQSVELDVVDLSDTTAPVFRDAIVIPTDEEFVGLNASGDDLFVDVKLPYDLDGDSRPYVRHYTRRIDLSQPASPVVGHRINIPGKILEIQGDTLITQDTLWGEKIIEASINKLTLQDGLAYQQGARRFADQQVQHVMLDHAGHVVVDHRKAWRANYSDNYYDWQAYENVNKLTLVDLESADFASLAEIEIDDWAQLKGARAGRALYQVPGGLLVINLDDATQPFAQSYFPIQGWPQDIELAGDTIYFSAGRYGLYQFDVNEANLLIDED